jgi:hypothetical protein
LKTKKPDDGPPTDPDARNYSSYWAAHWGVTPQAIRDWLRRDDMPMPHDVPGMVAWAATPGRKPRGLLAKAAKLRESQGVTEPGQKYVDPDWSDFLANRPADASKDPLEELRDYYQIKLRKANAAGDENSIRIYSELVIKYEKAIRDNKLAADRMGIEVGQLVPRADVERWAFGIAYWLMRSTDAALDTLSAKLAPLAPGLEAAKVRATAEPFLLGSMILEPFARASIQAGIGLEPWLCDRMRKTCGDYLENGERSFDELVSALKTK